MMTKRWVSTAVFDLTGEIIETKCQTEYFNQLKSLSDNQSTSSISLKLIIFSNSWKASADKNKTQNLILWMKNYKVSWIISVASFYLSVTQEEVAYRQYHGTDFCNGGFSKAIRPKRVKHNM